MKIQQLIEEQMNIFEKGFQMGETVVDHRWDAWKGGVLPSDIKSFISSSTRKLIEAVGEEMLDVAVDQKDECPIVDDVLRQQRLKLKEIISSLK